MTRTRLSLISTTAVASLLGAALPAFAQAPAPAPMYAPAPAPMMAPAPAPEPMPVMPVAPVMAPKAADDMTGSVGIGVGIVAGSTGSDANGNGTGNLLIAPDTGNLMLKYWMSDSLAIVPRLTLTMTKSKTPPATEAGPTAWQFNPEVLASFVLLKGASTRLSAGIGLGLYLSKNIISGTDTTIGINLPIELGVEHFFTRWFSMGIAVHDQFLAYTKTGDQYSFGISVNTLAYMGSLFIYTD